MVASAALFAALAAGAAGPVPQHRGEECTCFGSLMKTRISPLLVLRNGTLAVVAAVAWLFAARHGAPGISPIDVVALAVLAYLAIVVRETRPSIAWAWPRLAVGSRSVENSAEGGSE